MNGPSRSISLVFIGMAVLLIGFFFLLNPFEFGEIRLPDGNRMAHHEHHYEFLGRVLMCAGAALGVLGGVGWSREKPNSE